MCDLDSAHPAKLSKKRKSAPLSAAPKFHKSSKSMQQRGAVAVGVQAPVVKTTDGVATLVDPMCAIAARASVVVSDDLGLDATLSLVDSSINSSKYYRLQALVAEDGHYFWTR